MKSLFRSQTAFDLIDLFTKSDKQFFLTELTKSLKKDPANILRELGKLQEEGIIGMNVENDKKYYALNAHYPLATELKGLFSRMRATDFDRKFRGNWILAEDIPNICPFFSRVWLNS